MLVVGGERLEEDREPREAREAEVCSLFKAACGALLCRMVVIKNKGCLNSKLSEAYLENKRIFTQF